MLSQEFPPSRDKSSPLLKSLNEHWRTNFYLRGTATANSSYFLEVWLFFFIIAKARHHPDGSLNYRGLVHYISQMNCV